jgi:polyhydroxyalkanoate synthase
VLVPSLINPPRILDLDEQVSLTSAIAAMGRRTLLLDWGTADDRAELTVAGHVEQLLLPLLRSIGEPVALVGYCLGGTMAIADVSDTCSSRSRMRGGLISDGTSTAAGPEPP